LLNVHKVILKRTPFLFQPFKLREQNRSEVLQCDADALGRI